MLVLLRGLRCRFGAVVLGRSGWARERTHGQRLQSKQPRRPSTLHARGHAFEKRTPARIAARRSSVEQWPSIDDEVQTRACAGEARYDLHRLAGHTNPGSLNNRKWAVADAGVASKRLALNAGGSVARYGSELGAQPMAIVFGKGPRSVTSLHPVPWVR